MHALRIRHHPTSQKTLVRPSSTEKVVDLQGQQPVAALSNWKQPQQLVGLSGEEGSEAAVRQIPDQTQHLSDMIAQTPADASTQRLEKGLLIEELPATPADRHQPPNTSATNDSSNSQHLIDLHKRIEALEAGSRRMERKIDQILEYSRVMAQNFLPV